MKTSSGLERLTLEGIGTIDNGKIGAAFGLALRTCVDDCMDRPELDKDRKVVVTITVRPKREENGILRCAFAADVKEAVPKKCSAEYEMLASQGSLLYRELSREDVDQTTLPFGEVGATKKTAASDKSSAVGE